MSTTPPRYRTLDRPGPGLARIAEPDGRVALWSLNLRGRRFRSCAQCGAVTTRVYHRAISQGRLQGRTRLCRACVEGAPAA